MTESTYVNSWISKGELRTTRSLLTKLIQARFPVGSDLVIERVRSEEDFKKLSRWYDIALICATVQELEAAQQQP